MSNDSFLFVAECPTPIAVITYDLDEMMWYQYLPIKMAGDNEFLMEERLEPLFPFVNAIYDRVGLDDYVYLTAKHGWATPGNPLNRPGWHVDAFGHPEDRNYVWTDRFPTRYVLGEIEDLPTDDHEALDVFEAKAPEMEQRRVELAVLYEFGQNVLHATPEITEGGMRRFVKLSVSPNRFNLKGNSHNYLFKYDWKLYDRQEVRNDPSKALGDYYDDE